MRSIDTWLADYGSCHQNRANKVLHWICVPLIMLAIVAMLAGIPRPGAFSVSPWLHWGTVLIGAALVYYFFLAPRLALGMVAVSAALILATWGLEQLSWPIALTGGVIFVAAWVGQFIGHHFEGKRPAFLKDLQFLLIGPLWLLAWAYRRLNWPIV